MLACWIVQVAVVQRPSKHSITRFLRVGLSRTEDVPVVLGLDFGFHAPMPRPHCPHGLHSLGDGCPLSFFSAFSSLSTAAGSGFKNLQVRCGPDFICKEPNLVAQGRAALDSVRTELLRCFKHRFLCLTYLCIPCIMRLLLFATNWNLCASLDWHERLVASCI